VTPEEKMASPDLATRVAGRLDVIEENLSEVAWLNESCAQMLAGARNIPFWLFWWRAPLRAEAREDMRRVRALLAENDVLMTANAVDLAGRPR
jgi:hypothetical protein